MRARSDHFEKLDQVLDVIVEAEAPGRNRRIARIVPVGDVDVMLGQHGFDGVAQQRREVTRERRDQEHARLLGDHVLGEMQERAEWRDVRGFLAHRHLLVRDRDTVDAVGRAHMGEPGARDQLIGRAEVLDDGTGKAVHRRERVDRRAGPRPHRHHDVGMRLIRLVKHASRAADAAPQPNKSSTRHRKG